MGRTRRFMAKGQRGKRVAERKMPLHEGSRREGGQSGSLEKRLGLTGREEAERRSRASPLLLQLHFPLSPCLSA